tara:strand:- start:10298 stop:11929 length:1632 start_codon:yes stop_codon:yes gene_type:complete
MSYQNPQRIVNRVFEVFANGVQASNRAQQQDSERLVNAIRTNKQSSQRIMDSVEASKLEFAYKLDSIDVSSNNTAFSDNLKMFFNDQVEKYYQVKSSMATGKMDKRQGNMVLGQLMSQVEKFNTMIPEILSMSNTIYEQAGKFSTPGGISSTTPNNILDIFGSIGTGNNGGVYMIEEPRSGDLFFMKMPQDVENKFLEDGKVDDYELANYLKSSQAGDDKTAGGSILNLDQMMKMGPKSLVKYVPDNKKMFKGTTDILFKPNDVNSGFFGNETDYELVPDENKYEITTKRTVTAPQIARMRTNMVDQQAFQTALYDDTTMNSYWRDIMGQDTDYVTNNELQNKKNKQLARDFMIDQSIADMLLEQNLIRGVDNEKTGVREAGPTVVNGQVVWNPDIIPPAEANVISRSMAEVDKVSPQAEAVYLSAIADETKDGQTIRGVGSVYDEIQEIIKNTTDEESRNKQINVILNKEALPGVSYTSEKGFMDGKKEVKLFKDDGELDERLLLFTLAKPRMGSKTSINFPSFFKRYKNKSKNTAGLPDPS